MHTVLIRTLIPAIFTSTLSATTFAQENDLDDSLVLETIVVTAQKKIESVQQVGIAISAFSGDHLDILGVWDSTDIATYSSGVSLSGSFAGQQRQFSIRGVTQNDFNDHVESPNAIYIDEGYVAMQQGQIFPIFDLERVEVLKGPQGTLFGRNATGGLVHFITKKPTQDFEGYFDYSSGSYNQARVEGAVSGPISETARFRVSFLTNDQDGYLNNKFPQETFVPKELSDNLSNGEPLAQSGSDLGADDTWALRGQLSFDLSEVSQLNINSFITRSTQSTGPYQSTPTIAQLDENGNTLNTFRVGPDETREFILPDGVVFDNGFDNDRDGVRPVPGGDFYGYIDPDGMDFTTSSDYAFDDSNTYDTYGATVNYQHEFGDITFFSITDYKHHDKFTVLDLEAGPQSQFTWFGEADINSFTQEFRLAGEGESYRWVSGFYFLDIKALSISGLSGLANGTVLPDAGFSDFDEPRIADLDTSSYSIFGQMEYSLTDDVKLITGLRATYETKDYTFDVRYAADNSDPRGWDQDALNALSSRATGEFSADSGDMLYTGKLQLDWQLSDDVLVYTGFNRGVKAGSYNAGGPDLADELIPYEKEVLHSYEIGYKSTFFDGLARFNATAYYNDYNDYQASRWDGLGNIITNNDSSIKGLELDFVAAPLSNLELMLSASFINAKVKDLDLIGNGSILKDVKPTFSPDTTLTAVARYTFKNILDGYITLQTSANYQSSVYSNLSNFDSTKFDSFTVVDARLRWTSNNEQWQVDMFAKNLFDERYNVIGFDLSSICGCNEEAQGKPRWVGLSARYFYF
jgi:iron complex outermembrane receptor protein